ncbi:hypothetical protein B0H14DRAFT_2623015 [Mycena olivaceomarginata]|nr:hypothetical protein B0H14DRAFT_2623015 [Mycena olivaceomarginata]
MRAAPPPPTQPLPLSAFTRTLSPVSAPTSPPKRKKSSVSDDVPRPKRGDHDYVKRPENAFILFRRSRVSTTAGDSPNPIPAGKKQAPKQRQADLSKTISQQWKALAPAERAKWEELAKERKREHAEKHPGYVYRPQRSGAKNRTNSVPSTSTSDSTPQRKQSAPQQEQQQQHIEFIVPTARHGRSTSAPPPPHQAVLIPNVYALRSSYASSYPSLGENAPTAGPSFFPGAAEHTNSHSHSQENANADSSFLPDADAGALFTQYDMRNGFDYMPSFSFTAYEFEASLQSSDYLRAMFPPTVPPTSTSTNADGDAQPHYNVDTSSVYPPASPSSYPDAQPPPYTPDTPPSYLPTSPSYTYTSQPTSADGSPSPYPDAQSPAYPMESANAWAAARPGAPSPRLAPLARGSACRRATSISRESRRSVEFREHPHPGVYDEYEYEYEYEGDADMEGMHFGDPGAPFEMEFGEGGIVHVQSNDSEWNREESRVYPCPARKYSSTELQATQILRQDEP